MTDLNPDISIKDRAFLNSVLLRQSDYVRRNFGIETTRSEIGPRYDNDQHHRDYRDISEMWTYSK